MAGATPAVSVVSAAPTQLWHQPFTATGLNTSTGLGNPQYRGTVTGKGANLNVNATCIELNDAMQGFGTNEAAIIEVLSTHNNAELQAIKNVYYEKYKRVLGEDFIDELSNNFKKLCLYLLLPRDHYHALMLEQAIKGLCADVKGTQVTTLIDILCTRTNIIGREVELEAEIPREVLPEIPKEVLPEIPEIQRIINAYNQRFKGRSLKADIVSNTEAGLRDLLKALLEKPRPVELTTNIGNIRTDVLELINVYKSPVKVDTTLIITILTERSYLHLRELFKLYKTTTKKDIKDTIKAISSGHLQAGLIAIVRYVEEPVQQFAQWLCEAMKGVGTDNERLMWLCVDRCEIDLVNIALEFAKVYHKALSDAIGTETKFDYMRLLQKLTIITAATTVTPKPVTASETLTNKS